MPYHYKKGDDLNLAIMYARGWNDAVRASAEVANKFRRWSGSAMISNTDDCEGIAREIIKLDRSMEACDD